MRAAPVRGAGKGVGGLGTSLAMAIGEVTARVTAAYVKASRLRFQAGFDWGRAQETLCVILDEEP